jgi:hypothetical protein
MTSPFDIKKPDAIQNRTGQNRAGQNRSRPIRPAQETDPSESWVNLNDLTDMTDMTDMTDLDLTPTPSPTNNVDIPWWDREDAAPDLPEPVIPSNNAPVPYWQQDDTPDPAFPDLVVPPTPSNNADVPYWERQTTLETEIPDLSVKPVPGNNAPVPWWQQNTDSEGEATSLLGEEPTGQDNILSQNSNMDELEGSSDLDWLQTAAEKIGQKQNIGQVEPDMLSGAIADPFGLSNLETQQQINSDNKSRFSYSSNFREKIGKLESTGDYRSKNKQGFLGKYQMGETALQDTGHKDGKGNWTGKDGIHSDEDFFANKNVQENIFDQYIAIQESYLSRFGAYKYLETKPYPGVLGLGVKISESGLAAAAHRRGARAVKRYLEFQAANGWSSDFPPAKARIFKEIEKRIREFQNINHRGG